MSLNSFNACYLACYHGSKAFASTYGTLEIEGIEHIPDEGCVFASNHVSHLDPPLVGSCIPREIHYLARKTLFDIPVIGQVIERANSIPIDLEKGMDVTTKLIGGDLTVNYTDERVTLTGDAVMVYEGYFEF